MHPGKEKRVLIVEDDAAIRTLLEALLHRDGYVCELTASGTDAVARLREAEYDAILLDLMLPGQFGSEVIRFLKTERPALSPRVIVLTAASQAIVSTIDQTEVHAVMRKPFDLFALLESVRACANA